MYNDISSSIDKDLMKIKLSIQTIDFVISRNGHHHLLKSISKSMSVFIKTSLSVFQVFALPALLGSLSLQLVEEDRLTVVERGKTYYKDFLGRCRQYGVTQEEVPEDPEPRVQPSRGPPDLRAMQANREDKIRRYKQTKETEEKLRALGVWSEIRQRPEDVQVKLPQ